MISYDAASVTHVAVTNGVCASKGRGARYRQDGGGARSDDPYNVERSAPPPPTAESGPLNAVFAADDATEELSLFVRKNSALPVVPPPEPTAAEVARGALHTLKVAELKTELKVGRCRLNR